MGEADEVHVHARGTRRAAVAYIVVTVALATLAGWSAEGRDAYLTVWTVVGLLCLPPALLAAPRALRLVDALRTPLRFWYVGWGVLYLGGGLVYLVGVRDWAAGRWLASVLAVVGLAAFGLGNAVALSGRSGQRARSVDFSSLLVATIAVLGPAALLLAEPTLTSSDAWLALPAAGVAFGCLHAIGLLGLLYLRLPPGRRSHVGMCMAWCAATLVDASAMFGQVISGFTWPSGPLLGLHTAAVSGGLLLGVFARRGATPGLERFPPQRQVRRHDLLPAMVMASVLVTAALAVWRRDDPWVVTTAIVVLVELVLLSMVRQVGLGRETRRLYGEVERAADERLDLLADVMRSLDGDRARAAAQLHRQAAKLYTAMALSTGAEVATAQRVRVDLARQVDLSHQVLSVMRVGVGEDAGIDRLALTRAYIGALYADAPSPALEIEIDERLILDWMDEAVAFRIVQLAVHNIWRHAGASCIRVALRAQDDALVVTVDDDGVGFDPAGVMVGSGTGIATMRALADLVGGHVEIASGSGRGGTCVRAVLGRGPAPAPAPIEPRRPSLRVIR